MKAPVKTPRGELLYELESERDVLLLVLCMCVYSIRIHTREPSKAMAKGCSGSAFV